MNQSVILSVGTTPRIQDLSAIIDIFQCLAKISLLLKYKFVIWTNVWSRKFIKND